MLVLFDVDGTLTCTTDCDLKCYAATLEKVFGMPLPSHDWHDYRHVTDSGIICELLEANRGRAATPEEMAHFEEEFATALRAEYEADPRAFAAVPGAVALFEDLVGRGMRVALASGGMRRTALFKLACAGIDGTRVPGAFANDALTREGIARCAIERAGGSLDDDDVVYVGDGLWDVRTSASLGMRFIGITRESCPDRLSSGGATVCLEDYRDPEAFAVALRVATVPRVEE
jgi:phosphoglycolate phosphatase-like HAD superfamily hydrolase